MGPPGDWPLQQWEPRHLRLWLLLGGRGAHGAGVGGWVSQEPRTQEASWRTDQRGSPSLNKREVWSLPQGQSSSQALCLSPHPRPAGFEARAGRGTCLTCHTAGSVASRAQAPSLGLLPQALRSPCPLQGPWGWDAQPGRTPHLHAQTRRGSRGPQGSQAVPSCWTLSCLPRGWQGLQDSPCPPEPSPHVQSPLGAAPGKSRPAQTSCARAPGPQEQRDCTPRLRDLAELPGSREAIHHGCSSAVSARPGSRPQPTLCLLAAAASRLQKAL